MRHWADWIRQALTPTPEEVTKLSEPLDVSIIKACAEATEPTWWEVERFLATREARERRRRRNRALTYGVMGLAVVSAALCTGMVVLPDETPVVHTVRLTPGEPMWIGSMVDLGPTVKVEGVAMVTFTPPKVSTDPLRLDLMQGSLQIQIEPSPEFERLEVRALDVTLITTDARFYVVHHPNALYLKVHDGSVEVERNGQLTAVSAGEDHRIQFQIAAATPEPLEPEPLAPTVIAPPKREVAPYHPAKIEPVAPPGPAVIPIDTPDPGTDGAPEGDESLEPAVAEIEPAQEPENQLGYSKDVLAFSAIQDVMGHESDDVVLAQLEAFVVEYPDSALVKEATFRRLEYRATTAEPTTVIDEIDTVLFADPRGTRAVDLHRLRVHLALDRLNDCDLASSSLLFVAEHGRGTWALQAIAQRGLCQGAAGRSEEARQLLEQAAAGDLPMALDQAVDDALEKLKTAGR